MGAATGRAIEMSDCAVMERSPRLWATPPVRDGHNPNIRVDHNEATRLVVQQGMGVIEIVGVQPHPRRPATICGPREVGGQGERLSVEPCP